MLSAQTILAELRKRGIALVYQDGKLLSRPAIPDDLIPALRENKDAIVDALWAKEVEAAITRLTLGETSAVRLYSRTCGGQFLILRDDNIPESITIDCPTFTLSELRRLADSDRAHIKRIYQLKQVFPGGEVITHAR